MRRLLAVLAALTLLLGGCGGGGTSPASTEPPSPTETDAGGSALRVYCFQAGKADAFLFWNEAGAVLLDTGESGFGKTILAKLKELGIRRLDWLILTHFDKDHVGGAKKVLSDFPVDAVLQSNCPKEGAEAYEKYLAALEAAGIEAVTVREPLRFELGDAVFEIDPPALERYPEDESNNSSLIVTVTHGADRLLFLGDAEDLRLAEFLAGDPAPCGFVKLPHHGAWHAPLEALLTRTAPVRALITSSDEEPEDPETLALLEALGVELLLTRKAPVLLVSTGSGLTASYE